MSNRIYSYQGKASDWRLIDQRLHPVRLAHLWKVWTDSINSKPDSKESRKVMPI